MAILAQCPVCKTRQSVKKKVCKKCGENLDKAKKANRLEYWISYRLPNGKQKQEPVGKGIEEARAADGKKKSLKREGKLFDVAQESRLTFAELSKWYLELEKTKGLASCKTIKIYLKKFNSEFGKRKVALIKQVDLENLQEKRKKEGLKPKTIDDEINYAKTMVIKGFHNDKVPGNALKAFQRVKPLLKKGSNARDRVLSKEEFDRLHANAPRHLKPILTIGFWCGMRKGEIINLTWDKVNLEERFIQLEAEDVKEGKEKTIPLGTEPLKALKGLPRSLQDNHVILYNGQPIVNHFDVSIKAACKAAGILWGKKEKDGFIFHDLRHTFVTNMRKAGVPRSVRMSITGHSGGNDMDFRYDKVTVEDQLEAIKKLEVFFKNVTQNVNNGVVAAI